MATSPALTSPVSTTNSGLNPFTFLTNLATGDFALEPKIAVGQGAALGSVWVLYKDYSLANAPLRGAGGRGHEHKWLRIKFPDRVELVPWFPDITATLRLRRLIAVDDQRGGQVLVVYQTLHDSPGTANDFVSVDRDGLGPNFFGPAVLAATNVIGGNTIIPARILVRV